GSLRRITPKRKLCWSTCSRRSRTEIRSEDFFNALGLVTASLGETFYISLRSDDCFCFERCGGSPPAECAARSGVANQRRDRASARHICGRRFGGRCAAASVAGIDYDGYARRAERFHSK